MRLATQLLALCAAALVFSTLAATVGAGQYPGGESRFPANPEPRAKAVFSVPQNVVHVLANALMPLASVRLSHVVETATSTFIFGLIVVWILHRRSA